MWLTCIMPMLTGCADANKDYYTVGEWLDIVELNFNMLYYDQAEPYFPNVAPEDEDYSTAQIAAEWGLVDPALGIDLNQKVTKEYAADTLVKAMNFNYEAQVDIADTDKINSGNLHNIAIAVNEGIFALNSGKFEPKKVVSRTEADQAMAVAMDKWINLSYTESYNNSVVHENVVNLGGLDSAQAALIPCEFDVQYSGDTTVLDAEGNFVDNSTKTITIPAGENVAFEVGSVLSMPADEYMPTSYAVVVDSITTNVDGSVTVATHNAEFTEVYQDLDVQFGGELDLDNAVVYDMQGNRLSGGVQPESEGMSLVGDAYQAMKNGDTVQMADKVSGSGEVKIGKNTKVSYSISGKEVSFKIDTKIGDNIKVSFDKKTAIDLDAKIDIEGCWAIPPVRVKTARAVVTLSDHLGGNLSYSQDFSANNGVMAFEGGSIKGEDLAELYEMSSALLSILSEDMGKAAGELSAPLFKFVVPTPAGINAEFIIRLNLSLSGEISFSVDTTAKVGAEYVNKKVRPINDFNFSQKLDMEAKAELTLFIGAGIGVGCWTVVDAGADVGIGAKVNTKFYQIDSVTGAVAQECALPTGMFGGTAQGEGFEITMDEDIRGCVDFIAYPIVEVKICTSECLLGKFVDGYSKRVLGEANAFYKYHYEIDNGEVEACTREGGETFTIEVGDTLTLNTDAAVLAIGETYDKIKVRTLPEQYSASDLVFTVEDQGVASVQNMMSNMKGSGMLTKLSFFNTKKGVDYNQTKYKKYTANDSAQSKVTGVADGVTMLTVSTKDGRYSAQCKVVVGNGGLKESILRTLIIDKFSLKLVPGASGQINVIEAPADYTIADVTFTSSDTSVATVSGSGTVTAVGNGFATIKVSTTDGAFSASCMVYVSSTAATA